MSGRILQNREGGKCLREIIVDRENGAKAFVLFELTKGNIAEIKDRYKDYPGYFEIERWTGTSDGPVILCIDLRSKGLDSPSNWKDEINDVVDSWDVEERSILNLQFAPGTPPLSEIIKDFQDFKDNELSRLAFITKNVADAWERKSMGNEDLPLLRESHNLSAKCARITDISRK